MEKINEFMVAAKVASGMEGWITDSKQRSPLLKATVIDGLIACLRKVIAAGLPLESEFHGSRLARIAQVKFEDYNSSQWQGLGKEIFETCYAGAGGQISVTAEIFARLDGETTSATVK